MLTLPPPIFLGLNFSKLLIITTLFLSTINIAKADPNLDAEILSITKNYGACGDAATVIAGLTPGWVLPTYDTAYIQSIQLYVRDEKSGGLYQDRLIASAGKQANFVSSVTFNNVFGVGLIKAVITLYTVNEADGVATYTYESNLYTDETLIAIQAPKINTMAVTGATGGTNPYDLKSCAGANYELDFDIDYTFGISNNPTATFEIVEIASCGGADISVVASYSFEESNNSDPFLDEFLDDMNSNFKSFVQNNTGLYRVRLTMGGSSYCGGGDTKQVCVDISNVPTFDNMYLIQNDEQPSTPLDTVPAPSSALNSILIGGFSGGLWAQLSSGDYDYFRFRLEYDNGGGYINVPLKTQYSSNNYTVGGTLNVQFNTMILNSGDFLFQNLGDYRVFLIVGVNGCAEDSTAGYFEIDGTWQFKRSDARSDQEVKPSKDIAIYPTPATDVVSIDYFDRQSKAFYSLTDFNGKLLLNGDLTDGKSSVNISTLPTGAYLIHITSSDGGLLHRQKIMKL